MKKIYRAIVVFSLAAFLLFTTVSMAPAKPAGPFYVGVFGGFVMPNDLRWSYENEDYYHDDDSYDESLDDSWALGVKVGYIIPQVPWLAVELEYTYLAEQDYNKTYHAGPYTYGYDGDFSAHNVMANLLFRCPPGKIHPYVGFGFGLSRATLDEKGTYEQNGTVYSYHMDKNDTAIAGQFIAGVNFEILPNLSADLTYKYFYCEYEIEDWDVEAGNHIFQAGINFHF
jgi:opacity protein-like surface antigen